MSTQNPSPATVILVTSIATLVIGFFVVIAVAPLVGMTFVQLAPWVIVVAALAGGVAYALRSERK